MSSSRTLEHGGCLPKPGLEPGFSSLRTAVSLLTTVTLVAAVLPPTWDGKRMPDPSAKDNRKYDMGTSQLSGFPTLNTTSQNSEGIPSYNLGTFALLRGLLLILFFLPVLRMTTDRDPHASRKWKIMVLCHLSGQ